MVTIVGVGQHIAACVTLALLAGSASSQVPVRRPSENPTRSSDSVAPADLATSERIEEVLRGVVAVRCENVVGSSIGSGFLIRPGVVVTCADVLRSMVRGSVTTSGGRDGSSRTLRIVEVLALDVENGLALLSIDERASADIPVLTLKPRGDSPPIGARVFAAAGDDATSFTLVEGRFEGYSEAVMRVSPKITVFTRGGPVVDERGGLIGIAVRQLVDGGYVGGAVPARRLEALLSRLDVPSREQAWPAVGLDGAWSAPAHVARALGVEVLIGTNSTQPSPVVVRPDGAAGARDSLSTIDATPGPGLDEYGPFISPNLKWLESAQLREHNRSTLDKVRIVGIRRSRYAGEYKLWSLAVMDPRSGYVNSDDFETFHFFVSAPDRYEEVRNAIREYREFDARIEFQVGHSGPHYTGPIGGSVQAVEWTDKNGKMVGYVKVYGR